MAFSLGLWLALLAARGEAPGLADPLPPPPEGQGPLIWLRPGPGAGLTGLAELAQRLRRHDGSLRFVLSPADADLPAPEGFPEGTRLLPLTEDRRASVARILHSYRPDLLVLTGADLPPALIWGARQAGLAVILADAYLSDADWRKRRWHSGLNAALIGALSAVLAQDEDSARRLRRLAGRGRPSAVPIAPPEAEHGPRIAVSGPIEATPDPLRHNEAEREALARILQARPVWLASACTEGDEAAVLAAHARAIQHAHRMLLILDPADPARGPVLAQDLAARGWQVALRSQDEDPEDEVQILIADTGDELGLWYRLAPVSFMGGTLQSGTCGRSPFEPAALGSAILYGPNESPQEVAYARLAAAEAARRVAGAAELADALVELLNADKAAQLAHNAWLVSSGGAGASEQVMGLVRMALAERLARADKARAPLAPASAMAPGTETPKATAKAL